MTARLWRRLTWALSLLCIAAGVAWIGLLGWNPSVDRMIERGPYGMLVPTLAWLAWLAGERWREVLRRS